MSKNINKEELEDLKELAKEQAAKDEPDNTEEKTDVISDESAEKEAKPKKKAKLSKSEQITELQYQLAELNDKYLRLFSDFDNYRKRTNKDKLDLIKTSSKEVIEGLLPVLDDFDRGLDALREHQVDEDAVHGIELIQRRLFNYLKTKGLEPMDSKGKEFDTDYHDAITQTPALSEDLKGKVVDVIEKGYLLNGTIIRHAKVVVGQ
jgi:molecular chaperone GrpE